MLVLPSLKATTCARFLRPHLRLGKIIKYNGNVAATIHSSTHLPQKEESACASHESDAAIEEARSNGGAMSRRLSEMTEESLEHGGRSTQKVIREAGFSEELKRRLEAKIADSKFKNEHSAAFAQLDMPVGRLRKDGLQAHCWTV